MTTRKIDNLGRIVIPKVLREEFGIKEGDELSIWGDYAHKRICIAQQGNDKYRIAREVLEELGCEVPKELKDKSGGEK